MENNVEEMKDKIVFNPYANAKSVYYIFGPFIGISVFFFFCNSVSVGVKFYFSIAFCFCIFVIWYATRRLRLQVTINAEIIELLNMVTKESYCASLSDFKIVYCEYSRGQAILLFSTECLEKKERHKLINKILSVKKGNPVLNIDGNICFCVNGDYKDRIGIIIRDSLRIIDKLYFDD